MGNSKAKRITFIISQLSNGGAERVVSTLSNALCSFCNVSVIMMSGSKIFYPIDNKVEIQELFFKKGFSLKRILELRRKIKSTKPDVVISFMTHINLYTIFSAIGIDTKIIVSERIYPRIKNRKKTQRFLRNIFYRFADGCVVQTEEIKACLNKRISGMSVIIPNPVMPGLPINNYEHRKKVIAAVGKVEPQKRYHILIEAYLKFADKYPEYKLNIYGRGKLENSLREKYGDKINFKGFTNKLHDEIATASIYIQTSAYEGMSNALMEAIAIGTPCISTNSFGGGAAKLTQNGKYGILIDIDDKNDLVEKMEYLIQNSDEAANMGSEGNRYIRSEYSVEKISATWISYIEQVLGR